ncbi:hypothetical protein HDU76_005950, partial [Blyttiomyces sp. JEL0837]
MLADTVFCAKVHCDGDDAMFLDVASPVTLAAFKESIAAELSLAPTSITIYHVNPSGSRTKVAGDRSLLMLLTAADEKSEAATFVCDGTPIGKQSTMTKISAPATSSTFVLKVVYEGTDYAVEIRSPSLEEFGQEFAWNKGDLESMQILHNTTVVTSSTYFERILTTYQQSESSTVADVELSVRPKELPCRPVPASVTSLDSLATSALVQVSPLVEGVAPAGYDVMLSYEWTTGKTLVQIIKKELESRGIRVWFDEEQMRANMYERMAEAIANSSVVTPILTVAYSKSANCKRELSYAGDLKKHIEPARALNKNEKLERWVELITAGTIYYDFSEALNDQQKLGDSITALCNSIEKHLVASKQVRDVDAGENGIGKSPHEEWLVPVDFENDAERLKSDYVPGTRVWAIDGVHEWLLNEDMKRLLWLNGGAGLGKSIIAYLVSTNLPPTFILGSIFFCKHDDGSKNKAEKIVSTMAYNLSTKLPTFNTFLNAAMEIDKLKVSKGENSILSSPSTAFKDLIIKGLNSIPKPDQNILIIVDALDEIGKQGDQARNDFLNVLRFDVGKLPSWVRLFVTSRPEMDIYRVLNGVNSSVLVPEDSHNLEDIEMFVRFQLSSRLSVDEALTDEQVNTVASRLARKTGG